MRGGVGARLAASPVMVGAVTVLIAILAVFLAYNANSGLPFVPTYKISAQVPNANTLLPGNEVRIGGVRVGVVEDVEPIQDEDGTRQREARPVARRRAPSRFRSTPRSSSAPARRSASSTWRSSAAPPARASLAGAIMPVSAAEVEPVDIDEVLNTFDEPDADRDPGATSSSSATRSPAAGRRSTRRSAACGRCCPSSSA